MQATQQVFRVRRQYNRWVGNQTLEDYALRFTAKNARRWPIDKVAKTALGATAFLALEAIAAALTLSYGFTNTLWAMLTVALVIFVTGLPISYYAAKYGLDIDLLTRGAGFGYLGSTITSLIYASFTFIFFAIEAAILASAINALFYIPLPIAYVLCAVAVIPIVTHGISAISRFQIGTQNLWLVLQITAIAAAIYFEFSHLDGWLNYAPAELPAAKEFDLVLFGAAASILFAMVAQIGEQVDYLRFMPEKTQENRKRWWFWLIFAGPGWIIPGLIKMLLGSFLAYVAISEGMGFITAADPTHMYQRVYLHLTHSPTFALILAATMVVISQLKINVTNAYAGSIAWSNFFSRLTHSHPGRVVWLVFNVVIALILMELGIYRALEAILSVFAIVAVSWLGSLAADLMINKTFGLSPPFIEFKRAHLYDINPVGVGSMVFASIGGFICYLGGFGEQIQNLAHFLTLFLCFILVPLIAWFTKGKYYIARYSPELINAHVMDSALPRSAKAGEKHLLGLQCCICENHFETEDMAHCPAYKGPICSLCCSLDSRCMDSCKPQARLSKQATRFFALFMPYRSANFINTQIGRLALILLCVNTITGAVLALIYFQLKSAVLSETLLLQQALVTVFFILLIISGVISWIFLLTHESRVIAQKESNRQTRRLIREIEAHKKTDQALQSAKELAERANSAKSRYLTGISHELRTPLQSILGYAQLLCQKDDIPKQNLNALQIIRRSAAYLTDLIEGLLDVSKIEAGRIEIYRNYVKLPEFLDQLVDMFRKQAEDKGLKFHYRLHHRLPNTVITDEKRLRQILINILSNAIKYTEKGRVDFDVYYRNQVAEFCVTDTGIGIAKKDLERIMSPFERVLHFGDTSISGTGLGLTISQLLVEIMGGEIKVESSVGSGSCFNVSLMMSWVDHPYDQSQTNRKIVAYEGNKKSLAIVDNENSHRELLKDIFGPLGFKIHEAHNGLRCLNELVPLSPDLYLLDVSMPEMSGIDLAKILRHRKVDAPIIMISADAQEHHITDDEKQAHNAYFVKPIDIHKLLVKVGELLKIDWQVMEEEDHSHFDNTNPLPENAQIPDHALVRELTAYAQIGYKKGVVETLEKMQQQQLLDAKLLNHFSYLATNLRFEQLTAYLEAHNHEQ